jgi:hypothetical protein
MAVEWKSSLPGQENVDCGSLSLVVVEYGSGHWRWLIWDDERLIDDGTAPTRDEAKAAAVRAAREWADTVRREVYAATEGA